MEVLRSQPTQAATIALGAPDRTRRLREASGEVAA